MVKNAADRLVPAKVNGVKQQPYRGIGESEPTGFKAKPRVRSCAQYPEDGNKVVKTLTAALKKAGIKNGMTISTHHHLRNGDALTNHLFDAIKRLGVRGIRWYPSASFPCHEYLIKCLDDGTIHHIEGSMNGPLGRFASLGKMRGTGVLRSHGTRYQAVQDGEVHIDIAVLAAPTADPFGNANGLTGPSACGPLGFALADSEYADNVIVVTDNLVPFPCVPWHIQGNNVDSVVVVDSLGDSSKIVSGTTEITKSPDRLLIAAYVARFIEEAGIMHDGFSIQAGAGGINLAFLLSLKERMKKAGVKARFMRGGSTKYLVEMLEEGLTDFILDGQALVGIGPATREHKSVYKLQLSWQREFCFDAGCCCSGRDRGGCEFQWKRRHTLRRFAVAWTRRLAGLPLCEVLDSCRPFIPRQGSDHRR